MAPKLGQEYVRSLRADGLSEATIREHLKAMGYKAGRITQLLAATAASGSRDLPAAMDAEAGNHVLLPQDLSCMKLGPCNVLHDKSAKCVRSAVFDRRTPRLKWLRPRPGGLREVKAMYGSVCVCGGPLCQEDLLPGALEDLGVVALPFDATGLPRIRGKQAPFGGWERLSPAAGVELKQGVEQQDSGRSERWIKKCQGRDGQACSFGKNGKALRGSYGHRQCLWCSPKRLGGSM